MHLCKTIFIICLMISGLSSHANPSFDPHPSSKALQEKINFWVTMFTQYDSKTVIFHDSDDLNIVYTTLRLGNHRLRNQRLMDTTLLKVKNRLQSIIDKRFYRLDEEETKILQSIPRPRSIEKLKKLKQSIRYQQGLSDSFINSIKRSGRYLTMIKKILSEHGIPEDLAYLPHVESSFDVYAVSKYGASGLWQFTYRTGKQYLRINHSLDERRDPQKSTVAAAKLLKHNFKKLNNWPLAITAYNHGANGMRRLVKKYKTDNIENLFQHSGGSFGFASKNFYASFLAARHVATNYKRYFPNVKFFRPIHFEEVKLANATYVENLVHLDPNFTLTDLILLNPSLKSTVAQNVRPIPAGFSLRIPTKAKALIENPTNLFAKNALQNVPKDNTKSLLPYIWVQLKEGNTLYELATRYGTSVSELRTINQLDSEQKLQAGDWLLTPFRQESSESSESIQTASLATDPIREPQETSTQEPHLVIQNQPLPLQPLMRFMRCDLSNAFLGYNNNRCLGTAPLVAPMQTRRIDQGPELVKQLAFHYLMPYQVPTSDTHVAIKLMPDESLEMLADWADMKLDLLKHLNEGMNDLTMNPGQSILLPAIDASKLIDVRKRYYLQLAELFFQQHRMTMIRPYVVESSLTLNEVLTQFEHIPAWLIVELNPHLLSFPRVFKHDVLYLPVIESTQKSYLSAAYKDSKPQSTF